MFALFVELPPFERHRREYLDDDAFQALQVLLMEHPQAGDVIQGTGLRKIRFADAGRGKGKRGGIRVIYYWWAKGGQFWLFTVYGKRCAGRPDCGAEVDAQEAAGYGVADEGGDMKRDVFADLIEGFDGLADEREGKATLRSHKLELGALKVVSADELLAIRERLNMSRPVFARVLRTNARTLENWEQGRARPNAQATTLIRLVQKYPETVGYLATLE